MSHDVFWISRFLLLCFISTRKLSNNIIYTPYIYICKLKTTYQREFWKRDIRY